MSGKEGAIQLASKALMMKSSDKSLHYKGNTIIETTTETDDTRQEVIDTHTHTQCQKAFRYNKRDT